MQLVKLQCEKTSYVLMNDGGEYSPILTDSEVELFSTSYVKEEHLVKDFSAQLPSCPIMFRQTVHVTPKPESNENKKESNSPSVTPPMDEKNATKRKIVPANKRES